MACFSRKLYPAQQNCTVMEQELLSILEVSKAHRNMLCGCKELIVHTDHKNLAFHKLNSRRVLCWHLLLEDFAPEFECIKSAHNSIADSPSRLGITSFASMGELGQGENAIFPQNDSFSPVEVDSPSVLDGFVHHPTVMEMKAVGNAECHAFAVSSPLPHSNLRERQLEDSQLLENAKLNLSLRKLISFGHVTLNCCVFVPPTLMSTESASLPIHFPKSLNGIMKPWAMLVREDCKTPSLLVCTILI